MSILKTTVRNGITGALLFLLLATLFGCTRDPVAREDCVVIDGVVHCT